MTYIQKVIGELNLYSGYFNNYGTPLELGLDVFYNLKPGKIVVVDILNIMTTLVIDIERDLNHLTIEKKNLAVSIYITCIMFMVETYSIANFIRDGVDNYFVFSEMNEDEDFETDGIVEDYIHSTIDVFIQKKIMDNNSTVYDIINEIVFEQAFDHVSMILTYLDSVKVLKDSSIIIFNNTILNEKSNFMQDVGSFLIYIGIE